MQRPLTQFPKIIHQTWKNREVPEPFAFWSSSWKRLHPDYEYRLWTDADNLEFIATHYPDFVEEFLSFDQHIKRVDAVRYFYLYHYGGIYCDLDFECLKNFDPLLAESQNVDVVLGYMGDDNDFEHAIPNAIMISKPRAPFWLYVINEMRKRLNTCEPEYETGPVLLKYCCDHYDRKNELSILRSDRFYGINWNSDEGHAIRYRVITRKNLLTPSEKRSHFPHAYAVTYWAHSWVEGYKPEHMLVRKFKNSLRKIKRRIIAKN